MNEDQELASQKEEAKVLSDQVFKYFILACAIALSVIFLAYRPMQELMDDALPLKLPGTDITMTMGTFIRFAPLVALGMLFYCHALLWRVEHLADQNIFAPQNHFFTIRKTSLQVLSDIAFYLLPIFATFAIFVLFYFREERVMHLIVAGIALGALPVIYLKRYLKSSQTWRRIASIAFFGICLVAFTGNLALLRVSGIGAYLPLHLRVTNPDLRGKDFTEILGAKDDPKRVGGLHLDGRCIATSSFANLDLSGSSFKGAHLEGVDFSNTILKNVDFSGAYMKGALLNGTDLERANLSGAFLGGAEIRGNASFFEANLSDTDLSGVTIDGAKFFNAVMSGSQFVAAKITGATFSEATLECVNFQESDMADLLFLKADAPNARLNHAQLSQVDIEDGDWSASTWWSSEIKGKVEVLGTNLDGASGMLPILEKFEFPDGKIVGTLSHARNPDADTARWIKQCGRASIQFYQDAMDLC